MAHRQTLILPHDVNARREFFEVGELRRREAAELIVGYSFDLQTNELIPEEGAESRCGQGACFPGLAAEWLRDRTRRHAEHPAANR